MRSPHCCGRPVVVAIITARPVVLPRHVAITTLLRSSRCRCDQHCTSRSCAPPRCDHHIVAVVPLSLRSTLHVPKLSPATLRSPHCCGRPVVVAINTARPVVVPRHVAITTLLRSSRCRCDQHCTSRSCPPSRCDHHIVAVVPFWPFDGAIITAGVGGWNTLCVVVDMKQKQSGAVSVCDRV